MHNPPLPSGRGLKSSDNAYSAAAASDEKRGMTFSANMSMPFNTSLKGTKPGLGQMVTCCCQRRSKISPPGRSKTSPLNVMRYAVLGGCPGSP